MVCDEKGSGLGVSVGSPSSHPYPQGTRSVPVSGCLHFSRSGARCLQSLVRDQTQGKRGVGEPDGNLYGRDPTT